MTDPTITTTPDPDDDHILGACRPPCSPACWKAKLRSLTLNLPSGFRAVPKEK